MTNIIRSKVLSKRQTKDVTWSKCCQGAPLWPLVFCAALGNCKCETNKEMLRCEWHHLNVSFSHNQILKFSKVSGSEIYLKTTLLLNSLIYTNVPFFRSTNKMPPHTRCLVCPILQTVRRVQFCFNDLPRSSLVNRLVRGEGQRRSSLPGGGRSVCGGDSLSCFWALFSWMAVCQQKRLEHSPTWTAVSVHTTIGLPYHAATEP